MLLPAVGVRLVKGDVVAEIVKRPDQPAVVGRRPVPIRRHEAGTEEGNLHCVTASTLQPPCPASPFLPSESESDEALRRGSPEPGPPACHALRGDRDEA